MLRPPGGSGDERGKPCELSTLPPQPFPQKMKKKNPSPGELYDLGFVRLIVLQNKNTEKFCYKFLYRDFWTILTLHNRNILFQADF